MGHFRSEICVPYLNSFCFRSLVFYFQKAIQDTYNLPASKIHAYVHYQPSYYHLHVHFLHIKFDAPGFGADRAHLLTDVMDNIELRNDFYQKKTLTYCLREQEDLYKCYKDAGYFDKSA